MNGVEFTEEALLAAKTIKSENKIYENKPLRLYLGGKGCDGFDYGICFDQEEDQDLKFEFGTLMLVVDPETFLVVKGSKIDWVDDERGKGFIVKNPNHDKFKGKFFRKKDWRERIS